MTTLEFKVVIRMKATFVFTFGDINLFFTGVAMRDFDVDLSISVMAVGISVAANDVDVSG